MKGIKTVLLFLLVLLIAALLFPVDFPKLKGRVNDYANILTDSQEKNIEILLNDLEKKSTSQLVLLTIPSLEGETIEDYSIRLTEQKDWKIGQKGLDNGVILIISMKEKKLRIEVGYGLEGALTDLKCSYIIRKIIVPKFKKGDYFEGVLRGVSTISGIISKEYDISPKDLSRFKNRNKSSNFGNIIFFIFVLIFFILPLFSKRKGGRGSSIFWGGGSSGGGFGGFSGGGGSFGGGGASGGW